MKLLITLLVTLGISMGSYGVFKTGGMLLEECESEDAIDKAICIGFVTGVADTFNSVMGLELMPKTFCIPEQVTVGQLYKVVVKHLNEHPEDLHYRADNGVYMASIEAFPCKD